VSHTESRFENVVDVDRMLVDALLHGDSRAFDSLFRKYYPALCGYAMRMTDGDPDEAEDIVQQVFVKIWEQKDALEIKWTIKAYLYKMVHNRCLNWIRDKQNRARNLEQRQRLQEETVDHPELVEEELHTQLQSALGQLPPQCRQIFELSRFERLKYQEIADQLALSVKTVEAQMGKALRLMRTHLSDLFFWMPWLSSLIDYFLNA
jgi:RNA polymerase sigma-70 factor (ECF subfamily)